MSKSELILTIRGHLTSGNLKGLDLSVFPLVDLYIAEEEYGEALASLELLNEAYLQVGYKPEEKIRLEERKIDIYTILENERQVLISMKIIAETLQMFNSELYPEAVVKCLDYYDQMNDPNPSDKEYLQQLLLNYYKDYGYHADAARMIKEIIKHKAIHGIGVTLSDYYDCLYYSDNETTRGIIAENIQRLIDERMYEVGISEVVALKDLVALSRHFGMNELEQLVISELNRITAIEEHAYLKQFLS